MERKPRILGVEWAGPGSAAASPPLASLAAVPSSGAVTALVWLSHRCCELAGWGVGEALQGRWGGI